jgi:hypothetical protein
MSLYKYVLQIIHTPNFHPAMGITPITHTVVQQIDNVANNPIMMFIVAKVMIGTHCRVEIRSMYYLQNIFV